MPRSSMPTSISSTCRWRKSRSCRWPRRLLTAQDWAELDEAFAANRDPLTGHEPDDDYRALFSRIVNALPAPLGLGEAH